MNYTWHFGTGDKAIRRYGKKIGYKFSEPGKQTVSLLVKDNAFWSTPYQLQIELPEPPKPPIPRYEINPTKIYARQRVSLDASNTTDPDSFLKDLKFIWDFGDGTEYVSRENTTSHKYLFPGTFRVNLTVEDETGLNGTISTISVEVLNNLPIAKIKHIKDVKPGETVQLSAADSSDSDGNIVTYIWNFGDGTEVRTNESQVEHSWEETGRYTIDLTVQDDYGDTGEAQFQLAVKSESGATEFGEEEFGTILAGAVITLIVVIVIIVVVVASTRSKERI